MVKKQIIHIFQKSGQEIFSRYEQNLNTNDFSEEIKEYLETFEFSVDIFDESLLFNIHVKPELIKLSEIVPLAYEISSHISTFVQAKMSQKGTNITCKKGCSACCNYLVPLSIPEVFHLEQTVLAMPENVRNNIYKSFLISAKKIIEKGTKDLDLMKIEELSKWYSDLNISCPFLSKDVCSIYKNRPIACREYLVTGSNHLCNPDHNSGTHKITPPLSVLECLGKLSAKLKQTDIEAIMMPMSLFWAEEYPESDINSLSSVEIVTNFINIIKESLKESYSIALC